MTEKIMAVGKHDVFIKRVGNNVVMTVAIRGDIKNSVSLAFSVQGCFELIKHLQRYGQEVVASAPLEKGECCWNCQEFRDHRCLLFNRDVAKTNCCPCFSEEE